jgi:DNA polymerase
MKQPHHLTEFQNIVNAFAGNLKHQLDLGTGSLSSGDAAEMGAIIDGMVSGLSRKEIASRPGTLTLEKIREELGECTRCGLCEGRKHIVFGKGNPRAALVFVGEAPGREEDLAGEPFVGEAGQLLTRIIQAINLRREDVYIANVLKCRPPKNRDPKPEEIATCFPFLKMQLRAIRPRLICALGKFAAQTLLETTERISTLRGKIGEFQNIRVVPTFHPASLLRNPQWKRNVWQDMQLIQKLLEENC